MYNHDL